MALLLGQKDSLGFSPMPISGSANSGDRIEVIGFLSGFLASLVVFSKGFLYSVFSEVSDLRSAEPFVVYYGSGIPRPCGPPVCRRSRLLAAPRVIRTMRPDTG